MSTMLKIGKSINVGSMKSTTKPRVKAVDRVADAAHDDKRYADELACVRVLRGKRKDTL